MEPSSSIVENHEFLDVFLQPFSFKLKAECHVPENSGKYVLKNVRQRQNRDRWIRCQRTSWVQRKLLLKILVLWTARGIKSWIKVRFHRASGNWCGTATKTQQHILRSGDKMTLYLRPPGKSGESARSASSRKLERGDDIHIEGTR